MNSNISNLRDSFIILYSSYRTDLVIDYFRKLFPYIKEVEENKIQNNEIIKEIMNIHIKEYNISLLKKKKYFIRNMILIFVEILNIDY